MIRGGYKIIDLKNKELKANVGMVYSGIYDAIESTTKPILLSGLNYEGKEYPDAWITVEIHEANYILTYRWSGDAGISLTIEDTDVVTAAEF